MDPARKKIVDNYLQQRQRVSHSKDGTKTPEYEAALKALRDAGMNPDVVFSQYQAAKAKTLFRPRARTTSENSVSSTDSASNESMRSGDSTSTRMGRSGSNS